MKNIKNDETIRLEYDVAVIGSGSGGLASAVASSRQGARTVIIERNGYAGGMTCSGLPYLGYLDAKRRPVIGGIATEFVEELVKDGASLGVRYCPMHLSAVVVSPDMVKLTAARFLSENGVEILLHTELADAEVDGRTIKRVICRCAGTRIEISAKVFVDCTGDGTLAYLAGADYEKGTAGVDLQPSSIIFTVGGINKAAFLDYVEKTGDLGVYTRDYLDQSPNYVLVTLGKLWQKLNPIGEWPMGIWAMIYMNRLNETEAAINGPRMACTDATDPFSVTKAEIEGQKQAEQFVQTLRKHVGGFENAFLSHINDSIGVRETRRICGVRTLTVNDVKSGVNGPDTIALGAYPIDIHSSSDNTSYMVRFEEPYGIPYGVTVSCSLDNLMTGGRCISVDREAFGSTRVMGTCFAVSEAAGTGAALAVRHDIAPKDVDVNEIRQILLKNGGILEVSE